MIIEVMHFNFPDFYLNDSSLQPSREWMIGINTIINLKLSSSFPLAKNAVRWYPNILIKLAWPTWIMDIELVATNEEHLSIHPFSGSITYIDILS